MERETRTLSFRYSIAYDELVAVIHGEFDDWLRYELERGGVNDVHVAHRIATLVERYVPTSPRQLLELAMQCEELLGAELDAPMIAEQGENVYDALRFGINEHFGRGLWAHWHHLQDTEARSVDDVLGAGGGDASGNGRPRRRAGD